MPTNQPNYLRHDLIMLLVLLVIVAGALAGLWYADQHYGTFSNLAHTLLDQGK